jgi:ketosteroid isomerase-like protein
MRALQFARKPQLLSISTVGRILPPFGSTPPSTRAHFVTGSILSMRSRIFLTQLLAGLSLCLLSACTLHGQIGPAGPNSPASTLDPFAAPSSNGSLLTQPTLNADDAVSLSNGRPAVLGRGAIAAGANWDPKAYQLIWTPAGAQMGPSNDMGFTWGHYEGRSKDVHGEPVTVSGRYITVWKKLADGTWRVAMDASATEPPATGDCCVLPKP